MKSYLLCVQNMVASKIWSLIHPTGNAHVSSRMLSSLPLFPGRPEGDFRTDFRLRIEPERYTTYPLLANFLDFQNETSCRFMH